MTSFSCRDGSRNPSAFRHSRHVPTSHTTTSKTHAPAQQQHCAIRRFCTWRSLRTGGDTSGQQTRWVSLNGSADDLKKMEERSVFRRLSAILVDQARRMRLQAQHIGGPISRGSQSSEFSRGMTTIRRRPRPLSTQSCWPEGQSIRRNQCAYCDCWRTISPVLTVRANRLVFGPQH
jgi:hypothetical protein